MAANPFWTDTRLDAQRPVARALSLPSTATETGVGAVGSRANVRRRDLAIPSWVVFCTIMLATFAVCVTVTMRTHAARNSAEQKFMQMETEVKSIRDKNASLHQDVKRLREDPRAIEATVRERLNMIRANEVVIPLE
jgi:cell division protein FtsB